MKKNKPLLLLLAFLLLLGMTGLTGCGGKADSEKPDKQGGETAQEQDFPVVLYFANTDYVASGDESLDKLKTYETTVKADSDTVFQKTLELLKTSPKEDCYTMISDQIKFRSVKLDGDTVVVDLEGEGLNGGSLDETFLISQIVDTLLHSFDEVKQVKFLVDGETAETLMGHVGTADPFTKDLFTE